MSSLIKATISQIAVLAVLLVAAFTAGVDFGIATLLAGLIVLPEIYFSFVCVHVLKLQEANMVARIFRVRMYRFIATVMLLVIGLKILSPIENTAVAATWMISVILLVITPVISIIVNEARGLKSLKV